jgi:hypothetical protein
VVYRRNISREDGDVFSRLGAGTLDPTPGGSIRDFNGRVSNFISILCLKKSKIQSNFKTSPILVTKDISNFPTLILNDTNSR